MMMTTKFCVLNFKTGLYDEYKTKNEAIIAENGNETWATYNKPI